MHEHKNSLCGSALLCVPSSFQPLMPLASTSFRLVCSTCDCRELKPKHLVCLGGFRNTRKDIKYEGLKMELDETTYDWGKCYEIEIETVSVLTR